VAGMVVALVVAVVLHTFRFHKKGV
jgi:hypothetical protein